MKKIFNKLFNKKETNNEIFNEIIDLYIKLSKQNKTINLESFVKHITTENKKYFTLTQNPFSEDDERYLFFPNGGLLAPIINRIFEIENDLEEIKDFNTLHFNKHFVEMINILTVAHIMGINMELVLYEIGYTEEDLNEIITLTVIFNSISIINDNDLIVSYSNSYKLDDDFIFALIMNLKSGDFTKNKNIVIENKLFIDEVNAMVENNQLIHDKNLDYNKDMINFNGYNWFLKIQFIYCTYNIKG